MCMSQWHITFPTYVGNFTTSVGLAKHHATHTSMIQAKNYFKMKLGDQGKCFAPRIVCKGFVIGFFLSGLVANWSKCHLHPTAWREQPFYWLLFFALLNLRDLIRKKNAKSIKYPNLLSAIRSQPFVNELPAVTSNWPLNDTWWLRLGKRKWRPNRWQRFWNSSFNLWNKLRTTRSFCSEVGTSQEYLSGWNNAQNIWCLSTKNKSNIIQELRKDIRWIIQRIINQPDMVLCTNVTGLKSKSPLRC